MSSASTNQPAEPAVGEEHARNSSLRLAHLATALVCLLGALVWATPTLIRLRRVPENMWIARDDGVITLSHARNFADFGSIGVSPGGDRVEGFSSPLHFAVASAIEIVSSPSAKDLSLWILALGLIVTGAALTWGMLMLGRRASWRRAELVAIVVVFTVGVLSALPWTTTGWLGSGMENPLIVASLALVVAGVIAGLDHPVAQWVTIIGSFSLMVSRVEFAALCGPLLIALAACDLSNNGTRPLRATVRFVVVPLGAAALVHLVRRWYFGVWLPNTAIVQDRDAGIEQLVVIVTAALGFTSMCARQLLLERRSHRFAAASVAASCIVALFWFEATGRTAQPFSSLLLVPGVVEFGAAAAIGLVVRRWCSNAPIAPSHWVFGALVMLPAMQYVVTGAARLDDNRISGLAVPILAWWAVWAWFDAVSAIGLGQRIRRTSIDHRRTVAAAAALIVVVAAGATLRADGARALNYEIGWADELVAQVSEFRTEQFGGEALVIMATPDLGKVSFSKDSNIVDLGWLGDPLLASLRSVRPDLMDRYLLRVATPDVVAAHGGWLCAYRGWIEDPAFVAEYELIGDPAADWRRGPDTCPADGGFPRWRRVIDGGEYELTRALLASDEPAAVVRDALDSCIALPGDSLRCQPVRRAVQRAAPTLRDSGEFGAVLHAFEISPSAAFDRPMLERGPAWWESATPAVVVLLEEFVS